jgi:hypothetical protein
MGDVFCDNTTGVEECLLGGAEGDAMLGPVLLIFSLVPLKCCLHNGPNVSDMETISQY